VTRRRLSRLVAVAAAGALATAAIATAATSTRSAGSASRTTQTVTVSGTQWGTSSCYIGATEGNVRFNIQDLVAAGINTYRVYGGMSRWEAQDDDGVYGSPTIPQIKANPAVINWAWWDNVMTSPSNGSDYWWSGTPPSIWQGNARTILSGLQSAGIKVVLTLRNVDNNDNPAWAQQLNPPVDQNGWNEWWEHVFATVYWLDVRNNYNVTDFEVHNEPNNSGQGWGGTEAQYFQLVQQTKDAIDYVFTTYLPGKAYHVYAPVTTGGSSWPNDALQQVGSSFDSLDIHDYNSDVRSYVESAHGWLNADGYPNDPVWLSEWATYRGGYQNASKGVSLVLKNLVYMSYPGNDYVYGSHLFTFYDWAGFSGGFQNFQGLVAADGTRTSSFYALQMATRALIGCRPTYQSTTSSSNLLAITTKDAAGHYYLLVLNLSSNTSYSVNADLSKLLTTGTGTEWQYDATHNDTVVGSPALSGGHVTVTIPGSAAVLLQF
jgi:hypothetical protein